MLVVVLEFLSRPAAQHLWMHDDLEYLAHPYMPVPLRLARWESFKDEDRNVAAAGGVYDRNHAGRLGRR